MPQSLIPAPISAALNRSVCPIAHAAMNPPWLPSADPEPVRVRDPVRDEQVDPADDVGPLVAADRARDRRGEVTAMACAAPRVGQEDRVSRGREPLPRRVITGSMNWSAYRS